MCISSTHFELEVVPFLTFHEMFFMKNFQFYQKPTANQKDSNFVAGN